MTNELNTFFLQTQLNQKMATPHKRKATTSFWKIFHTNNCSTEFEYIMPTTCDPPALRFPDADVRHVQQHDRRSTTYCACARGSRYRHCWRWLDYSFMNEPPNSGCPSIISAGLLRWRTAVRIRTFRCWRPDLVSLSKVYSIPKVFTKILRFWTYV